ncbi:helix-turn-helix transcriptional regulator [Chitinophaga oryzae]|uniref:Helix-turn-helix transcriptional regulator n=1 Tax=Chitinophaga oryzae TaxID=2725414 RepID=A0AAE6ZG93_9BACT|nr:AraC family transcriptional regulator [Chitinophaga oryzae]QJB32438.1 helix-turn-helix transcriptional regulator [Chitinophaga oryzae]QJB38910.1 helix-turn-helix transcriptional regulator [Chitinophaga oryzae]
MVKIETLEIFYRDKIGRTPENLRQGAGHFNVFKTDYTSGLPLPPQEAYRRRDFYKIILTHGRSQIQFADKTVQVQRQALLFLNPQIPYSADRSQIHQSFCVVFNQHFFHRYGNLYEYPVYQPGGTHIFELTDEQVGQAEEIFRRMLEEKASDYIYKYDVLRNLAMELIHFALKTQLSAAIQVKQPQNAADRINTLFTELLERHYAIDDTTQQVVLRSAADFARHMNIHVNHLNRALKAATGSTTSQLIAARCLREAQSLLSQSNWTVAEIAYALGFVEPAHFNAFFKKQTGITPRQFRMV